MREPQSQIYKFGEFRINAAKSLLYRGEDEPIALTPKVFDTLLYLVQNSGKVIEKDELMREIWADTIVEENNLNKNISILRRILGENKNEHRFIVTIPGRGYKFVAEVRELLEVSGSEQQTPSSPQSKISAPELNNESESQDNGDYKVWNSEPKTSAL